MTDEDLNVDNFAGGGGATIGIEAALGRPVDYALNHDRDAIEMHRANHPYTHHVLNNIWRVDPRDIAGKRPIANAWFSPDCTHHSKAKGGKPLNRRIRALASVVPYWVKRLPLRQRPRRFFLENVEEFPSWGPLTPDNQPDPRRVGMSFNRWRSHLTNLGYHIEMRELYAHEYGVPTSRKRLFIVGRNDGLPIIWPRPTHGFGDLLPFKTAADCIDWSIPTASIFMSPEEAREWGRIHGMRPPHRPLEDATLRRTARGVMRYVVENPEPFFVPEHAQQITLRNESARVKTLLDKYTDGKVTQLAHIQRDFGQSIGQQMRLPLATVMPGGGGKTALVTSSIVKLKGTCRDGQRMDVPLHTVQASGLHYAEVRAFLVKYYGTDQDPRLELPLHTIPTHDRFALVIVHGTPYAIVDICLRMLKPRELFRAQGFPEDYIIAPIVERQVRNRMMMLPLTQTSQVRLCGNSVPPAWSEAIVRANNFDSLEEMEALAA